VVVNQVLVSFGSAEVTRESYVANPGGWTCWVRSYGNGMEDGRFASAFVVATTEEDVDRSLKQ